MKRKPAVLLVLLALLLPFVRPVSAQLNFTVNSELDQIDADTADGLCRTSAGTCTLRAAVMQANTVSGAGAVITLPAGEYALTRPAIGGNGPEEGDLNLLPPAAGQPLITILGAGADITRIDANQIDRVFSIAAGRLAILSGVTITGGYAVEAGGVYNLGSLTISYATLSGNAATLYDGGGVLNYGAMLVVDSRIAENAAQGGGGGIINLGTLEIDTSAIASNTASRGGGIFNDGALTMRDSEVSDNDAGDQQGGGLFNLGAAELTGSTIRDNRSTQEGGGIYNHEVGEIVFAGSAIEANATEAVGGGLYNAGLAELDHVVVSDNTSWLEGGGIFNHEIGDLHAVDSAIAANTAGYVGGGVYNDGLAHLERSAVYDNAGNHGGGILNSGSLIVVNSTISGNQALISGGGIYNQLVATFYSSTIAANQADADNSGIGGGGGVENEGGASFELGNTLIAGNVVGEGAGDECRGTLAVFGRNLIGVDAAAVGCAVDNAFGEWDYAGPDAIGPLGSNGGPTPTHALLPGSPALDAGDPLNGCFDPDGNPLPTDQRGWARVVGPRCDIGAVEYRPGWYLPVIGR